MRNVCVFCGSSEGLNPAYLRAAEQLGSALSSRGLGLVYGASGRGLMGAAAKAALNGGAPVIGVVPTFLKDKEPPLHGLTQLIEVKTMHERKARMADLSSAFVALPGGFGTLDELFEITTWRQLALHNKPVVLVNVDGFFDSLITFIHSQIRAGLIRSEHSDLVFCAPDVDTAMNYIESKWA